MSAPVADPPATCRPDKRHPGRWAALFVIALAQLMVVLDATIVNIALPQGTAPLNTIATTAAAAYVCDHPITDPAQLPDAAVHGYTVAFAWAAAVLAIGVSLVLVLVRAGRRDAAAATPAVHLG
ncbi:hypothetical protein LWC35_22275 [Pseudonocardia kujensis]|uniref:hypothetical protein n=1 Tax=Pseudonocardia kujensis TaxID=1128675 RepID=UPI001E318AC7|nr:hypothetical protein [Pseudonocardia kujensis]MCE0765610.1 hypothetical protein [Pseudonocardia kujensis]